MSFEMAVGLLVTDDEKYSQYRGEIAPLLEAARGRFRYDFKVGRTLISETGSDINRFFVLAFPDRSSKEQFFADSRYVEIRARLFAKAVQATTIIAEYAS